MKRSSLLALTIASIVSLSAQAHASSIKIVNKFDGIVVLTNSNESLEKVPVYLLKDQSENLDFPADYDEKITVTYAKEENLSAACTFTAFMSDGNVLRTRAVSKGPIRCSASMSSINGVTSATFAIR